MPERMLLFRCMRDQLPKKKITYSLQPGARIVGLKSYTVWILVTKATTMASKWIFAFHSQFATASTVANETDESIHSGYLISNRPQ